MPYIWLDTRNRVIYGIHHPYLVEYNMSPYLCHEVLDYYNNVYHNIVSLNSLEDAYGDDEPDYTE